MLVKSRSMDFLKIVYMTGGHWVCFSSPPFSCFLMSFFPFLLFLIPLLPPPFSPSFHGLPSVPFLLCYTLMLYSGLYTISLPLSRSPVPPSCHPRSFPFFHSITTLSATHMYHFHSIVLSIFFVSFDISCYKCYLIFY